MGNDNPYPSRRTQAIIEIHKRLKDIEHALWAIAIIGGLCGLAVVTLVSWFVFYGRI